MKDLLCSSHNIQPVLSSPHCKVRTGKKKESSSFGSCLLPPQSIPVPRGSPFSGVELSLPSQRRMAAGTQCPYLCQVRDKINHINTEPLFQNTMQPFHWQIREDSEHVVWTLATGVPFQSRGKYNLSLSFSLSHELLIAL